MPHPLTAPELCPLLTASHELTITDIVLQISQKSLSAYCITDQNGRYVGLNDAYAAFYGFRKQELLGNTVTCILPEDQHAAFWASYKSFLQMGEGDDDKWVVQTSSGNKRDVSVTSVRIELADLGTCVVSLVEPLT